MPIQTIIDNTYYVFDSGAAALPWPTRAKVAQVRILALNTTAAVSFQVAAGTPLLSWSYITHIAVNSGVAVVPSSFTIPLNGVTYPTAWIPTTMTAASAWIDFV